MTGMIPFVPELYTLCAAGVFLVMAMMGENHRREFAAALILSGIGLVITVAAVGAGGVLFAETYRIDVFSQMFKVLIYSGFVIVIGLCRNLSGVSKNRHAENYFLLSVCTLALMLLVSCVHLLTLYVALELSSYSLYVLVYLRKGREKGLEAGLKYFFIGATSSAVMLFGFALLYGAGHSGYLTDLEPALAGRINEPVVLVGFILSLSGFFFKLAVFPFHFWAPDVYEGAPHQISAYIATVSKVAGIAVLIRMISVSNSGVDALTIFLVVLSVLSMTVGNLAAIAQTDFKRMLAFSSVAHAGYVLIGILCADQAGFQGAIFYAASLLVMKLACFLAVIAVSRDGRNPMVSDLAGLHYRSPILALALMIALFGLAGIPPTFGFTAKLLIFSAAVNQGFLWLVVVAMINVVISLYYYLQAIKAAYFDEPTGTQPALTVSLPVKGLAMALIFGMIAGGMFPRVLIDLAWVMAQAVLR